MNNPIVIQVIEKRFRLPMNLQRKVLEFVETLTVSVPRGIPGNQLLPFKDITLQAPLRDSLSR